MESSTIPDMRGAAGGRQAATAKPPFIIAVVNPPCEAKIDNLPRSKMHLKACGNPHNSNIEKHYDTTI